MNFCTDSIIDSFKNYSSEDQEILKVIVEYFDSHFSNSPYDLESFSPFFLKTLNQLFGLGVDVQVLSGLFLMWFPDDKHFFEERFSYDVNVLLESVFSLESYEYLGMSSYRNHDVLRKMFLAMVKDIRVVLLYLSKKLLQLQLMKQGSNIDLAELMMNVYVPVASRLGMYGMKRRLEDICFYHLQPESYEFIHLAYSKRQELNEDSLEAIRTALCAYLSSKDLTCTVTSRLKGHYSTFSKLSQKGVNQLDRIFDLLAVRIIVSEELDCYHALSYLSSRYELVEGRLKDYVVAPKLNGYQSLHLTVLGLIPGYHDFPVEIQIRTERMHQDAEFGIASHWWYEQHGIHSQEHGSEIVKDRLKWVQNLIDLHEVLQNSQGEFDFFSDSIFILNIDNEVVELPRGATPLDFAYHESTEMGHRCDRVKVNGKEVGLDYELESGDRVDIIVDPAAEPSVYSLSLLETELAKSKLRAWLDQKGHDSYLRLGLEKINKKLKFQGLAPLEVKLRRLKRFEGRVLTMKAREELLVNVGRGNVSLSRVLHAIAPDHFLRTRRNVSTRSIKKVENNVLIAGGLGLNTKLSACCKPEDGERIIGYVTRGGFISVHRKDCKVLQSLDEMRVIEASWR